MANEYHHRRAIALLSLLSIIPAHHSFVVPPSSHHQQQQVARRHPKLEEVRFPSSSSRPSPPSAPSSSSHGGGGIGLSSFPDANELCRSSNSSRRRARRRLADEAGGGRRSGSPSCLNAIIYGWDHGDDPDDPEQQQQQQQQQALLYTTTTGSSEIGPGDCPADGLAVAESLSGDARRIGSFARLAAAFSPPDRGVGIRDIERVEVTCVHPDRIELEAVLCETQGCVTLSVPVRFPQECGGGGDDDDDLNQGCVFQNLDLLDDRAETSLSRARAAASESTMENADLDELVILNDSASYPNWWVSPELDAGLIRECDSIRSLLNEAEFHPEIVALAQEGMERNANSGRGWEEAAFSDYRVQRAKVAAVGPSGICMKVAAIQQSEPGRGTQYLDVAYPFSTSVTPIRDADQLRANVLGVIAAAEASSSTSSGGGNVAP